MQRRLSEHIAQLEEKIDVLKQQLCDDGVPPYQTAKYELDLTNAQQALGLLRRAYELIQKIPPRVEADCGPDLDSRTCGG